jgi:hypothetical protein
MFVMANLRTIPHMWDREKFMIELGTKFHLPRSSRAEKKGKFRTGEMCLFYVRFEFFTAVTVKNAVFWDVTPCRPCVNRCFGGTWVHTRSTRRHIPEYGILHGYFIFHKAALKTCVFFENLLKCILSGIEVKYR